MKTRKTGIIIVGFTIFALVLVALRLNSNKRGFQNEIELAQKEVDKIAVSVNPVFLGTISENITSTGILQSSKVLNVVAETQGKIIKVYKKKGDKVSVGDLLVKVDDEVIAANVLTAEANYDQYEKDIERLKRLSEENAVTKRDLEQAIIGMKKAKADLINARKALSNTSIKAPISGFINNDFVTEGQILGGGSPICEIVNNNLLKLNIKLTEREVYKIRVGQTVSIHLTAFPDKEFTGHITAIAEKADMAMKFDVELSLANNRDIPLKSGLYAEVILPVKNEERLLINKSAIVGSMESPVVYIAENGKAVKRNIIIGQSNDDHTEVLRGLSKDEKLIVRGQLNIKNGDAIRIVN